MSRLNKEQGYLVIDHRASPGIPEPLASQSGYDPRLCGEGKLFEASTLSCRHCRSVQIKNPLRTRERPYCRKCDAYICDTCAAASLAPEYTHMPFDKRVDDLLDLAAKAGFTIPLNLR